jgi:hypothetical protein
MGLTQEARLLQNQSVPRRMGLAHDFHVPRLTTDIAATGPAFSIPDAGVGSVTMRELENNQRGPGMYYPKYPTDVRQCRCVCDVGAAFRTCVSDVMDWVSVWLSVWCRFGSVLHDRDRKCPPTLCDYRCNLIWLCWTRIIWVPGDTIQNRFFPALRSLPSQPRVPRTSDVFGSVLIIDDNAHSYVLRECVVCQLSALMSFVCEGGERGSTCCCGCSSQPIVESLGPGAYDPIFPARAHSFKFPQSTRIIPVDDQFAEEPPPPRPEIFARNQSTQSLCLRQLNVWFSHQCVNLMRCMRFPFCC